MKRKWLIVLCGLLVFYPPATVAADYQLQPGDELDIAVTDYFNITGVVIRSDGKMSVPLAGEIEAEGLTLVDAAHVITERMKQYTDNPGVVVKLAKYHTNAPTLPHQLTCCG